MTFFFSFFAACQALWNVFIKLQEHQPPAPGQMSWGLRISKGFAIRNGRALTNERSQKPSQNYFDSHQEFRLVPKICHPLFPTPKKRECQKPKDTLKMTRLQPMRCLGGEGHLSPSLRMCVRFPELTKGRALASIWTRAHTCTEMFVFSKYQWSTALGNTEKGPKICIVLTVLTKAAWKQSWGRQKQTPPLIYRLFLLVGITKLEVPE